MEDKEAVVEPPVLTKRPSLSSLLRDELFDDESSMALRDEVELVVGFFPNERMRVLQSIAIVSDEQGLGYVRDWIKSARENDFFKGDKRITFGEWSGWLEQKGFSGWFYGGFPLPRQMSQADIDGLDALFWEQMRAMLREGDTKVMDLYAKITGKLNSVSDDGDGETAVVEWLSVNAGAVGWKKTRHLK